jgi:hypothetical protein
MWSPTFVGQTKDNVLLESSIRPFSYRADLIGSSALIAWDELPAANVAWLDCVDEVCRMITKKRRPFGGIPFVGVGDFRQVAPVVKGQGATPARLASIKSSNLWSKFDILTLHAPIRSADDPEYTEYVDRIGEDYVNEEVSIDILEHVTDIEDCIKFLFPPHVITNPAQCLKRAFLSPRNMFVDELNDNVLDRLPGQECDPPLFIHLSLTLIFPSQTRTTVLTG